MPDEVLDYVDELNGVCLDQGEKPGRADFVQHAEVGADGIEIWLLDEGRYDCGGHALWPGHGGSGITIYARLSSGKIKRVFDISALEARIDESDGPNRIWIHGDNELCGLPEPGTDEERNLRGTCLRPLDWDGKHEIFVLAPLSKAQPLKRRPH